MAKLKTLKQGVCYWVEWIDAYSGPNSWITDDDIESMTDGDYTVWTLGWFIKENKNYYVFCSTTSKDSSRKSAVWAIPKGMIVKVKEVGYD